MKKRILTGVAAATALALALTGCARADEDPNNTQAGGDHIAADLNEMNAQPEENLGEGGTLRLYNNAFPANFNTSTADGNERNTREIMDAVYPSLYKYTADGQVIPNELYAKRIEQTNESPQTFEIELVEGNKWSDGTPIDWKSIKNTFDAMVNEEFNVASREGFDRVEKVEKGDNDYTAVVTFKEGEVYADWIGLAGVMPDQLVESAKEFNEGWVSGPKVTAGPYTIDKIDSANKSVTLKPDENWTGARKAKLDRISFQTIEDPAAAATSFNGGQLDVIDASNLAIYSVVEPETGEGTDFEIRKAAGPSWSHFTLNGKEGYILEDQNLRQAFAYAIDRKSIFQAVNGTLPYPSGMADDLLGNHMLVQNQDGYKNFAGEYGTANVEKAKELIEKSGWIMGNDGYYQKDGKTLEIRYVYNAGSTVNGTIAPIATENLKAAGMKLKVEQVPPTDLFSKYVIPGDYDMTLFGWNGNPFVTSGVSIWRTDGEQNFSSVGTEEIDGLLDELQRTTDLDKQTELLNQIDEKLWPVMGNLPLYQSYDFIVTPKDLANYGAPGFESVDWTLVGYVKDSPKLKG
ncbi:ABC transporter family substrate-binding protein [uncultured Gulosibacter sp.]|uniref:ABC transporter family substrate-binding protein n=1 Tax=uncultured Gulosibacter sp. TaxID=1339167 RepID=UPI00288B9EF6|nr:ABC transporter family substrate-binding protein [uncultured Gulosibacter sp.]